MADSQIAELTRQRDLYAAQRDLLRSALEKILWDVRPPNLGGSLINPVHRAVARWAIEDSKTA